MTGGIKTEESCSKEATDVYLEIQNEELRRLRDNGNSLIQKGSVDEAIQCYSIALQQLNHCDKSDAVTAKQLALFYSNRSFAYTKVKDFENALKDALSSISSDPQWPRGYYRLGTSYLYLKRYRVAYDAAKRGLEMAQRRQSINLAKTFDSLIDQISYSSVLNDYYGVFDGKHLQVQPSSAEFELLTSPTPAPNANETICEHEHNSTCGLKTISNQLSTICQPGHRVYRCIEDALKDARDGDRIILGRGIHKIGGGSLHIDKRVLLEGDGTMGEVILDQRGNSPTFRISKHCVIQELFLTHTGFSDSVQVGDRARPIIKRCALKNDCSSVIVVNDHAAPAIVHSVIIDSKKTGIHFRDKSRGYIFRSIIRDNMGHGIVCGDMSSPTLSHLLVSNNGLGGITIKQKAGPLIDKTCITSNIGTGVDISSSARPKIRNCNIKTNIGGGVFCWDESMARLDSCDIDGGHSYAFISFGDCNSQLCSSTIRGVCINKDQISKEFGSDNDIILPEYASQLTISPKAFLPISANELRRGFDQTYY